MEENKLTIDNVVAITLTLKKPKKRGRSSKKDKEIYGIQHILTIPKDTPEEEKAQAFQKEADKLGLPVKFV